MTTSARAVCGRRQRGDDAAVGIGYECEPTSLMRSHCSLAKLTGINSPRNTGN